MTMEKFTQIHRKILKKPELVLYDELTARDVDTWDSLAHLSLIIAIEQSYNIRFENEEIILIRNIGDMLTLLRAKEVEI